ncbi:PDZ domain-containing protein [Longitalea arenae]|uniref:PDZ domain-containing protein n=1 Tax=Longitalea arenae TaxID=2812558 RepID=UPI0019682422|nr:PDZ domain-containing protein [Longitalea arenae]
MRRFLISGTAMAILTLMLCQPLAAQDKEKDKEKDKTTRITDNDEIIIKRKGDKDAKVTIEMKGDEVIVNGKPLDEFDDDDIVIKKGRSRVYGLAAPHSPFRGQGGTLSFGDNQLFLREGAMLGVFTEKDKDVKGAIIQKVTEGSAADKAGLKENDVIKKVENEVIDSPEDLTEVIGKHKPEDKVTITYERSGKTNKTEATLGRRKGNAMTYRPHEFEFPNFNFDWKDGDFGPRVFSNSGRPRLGIKAQDTEDGKGAKVLSVDDESPAEKAGIQEDDVITEFDGKKVNTADELVSAARESKDKAAVKITFNRNGKTQSVEVKTPKKLKTATL